MEWLILSITEVVAEFIVENAAKWILEAAVGAVVAYFADVAIELLMEMFAEAIGEAVSGLIMFLRTSLLPA